MVAVAPKADVSYDSGGIPAGKRAVSRERSALSSRGAGYPWRPGSFRRHFGRFAMISAAPFAARSTVRSTERWIC